MKTIFSKFLTWLAAAAFVAVGAFTWTGAVNAAHHESHEQAYIDIVENLVLYVDNKDWDAVANEIFADEVVLDYSSFTGDPAVVLSGQQIAAAWAGLIPGFDLTQHKLTNHRVRERGDRAYVSNDVLAIHIIDGAEGGDYWIVEGGYDFEIEDDKVILMRYNHESTSGNNDLAAIATSRAAAQ